VAIRLVWQAFAMELGYRYRLYPTVEQADALLGQMHIEANPRHLGRRERALRRSQRALARKRKGSANRAKQKARVAREHARVADARRDFQHQQTTSLVRSHDVICVETLNVAGMTATACGTLGRPGRNVRQKAGLNRAILDVGWSQTVAMLDYKTKLYGRELRRKQETGNPRG